MSDKAMIAVIFGMTWVTMLLAFILTWLMNLVQGGC